MITYSADKIFTGSEWLVDHTLITENGIITGIVATGPLLQNASVHYSGCIIVPSFIDLQIYGAHKRLLSVFPSAETLHEIYLYCKGGGAGYFMPTVATNTADVFYKCIDAVRQYWSSGGKGVLGLHIEGPWINKTKRGAHVEKLVHSPCVEEVEALLSYGEDVIKIITLAPEVCGKDIIALIKSRGVIISAGHSNATCTEATQAFDEGIHLATHLFNAMSQLQSREPGMVGAVMNHKNVMCGIIPDGKHVDFAALSIAKKVMGERLFIITDAVTETTEGYYPHIFEDDKYVAGGILSGSALTMGKGVKNCVEKAGIGLDEALRMASLYPARVIGMEDKVGRIVEGNAVEFTVLDSNLHVVTHND